ncbi:transcriptional regulator [Halanaerobium saccharolyticum]|uniref:Transcriptional regulator CtsR n=1 Tax=Halanaerobium saccharolyticum TaxID=43595 RepID=A0A4R7YZJ5_9FIRM|nr:CtsR family transcriptional regulator [Halanaerobium saccharolyticum]RAK07686.1 transcriptional regulator [Halanaerobium saccharolyticum]TDW03704.1 transcriptional regulator [Halanaerobium saccharolyticum]TDX59543.1 transcriptional regulator [Halanaerobium saccharolyticum]
MSSLSDQIEQYLRRQISKYQGKVKIKRNQLAENFDCAPSQINYVLDTRFTVENGYVVESQRGGGGFIKIIRVTLNSEKEVIQKVINKLDRAISQREAHGIIKRLYDNDLISERESYLMERAVHRNVLGISLPERDYLRGRILKNMLEVIFKVKED